MTVGEVYIGSCGEESGWLAGTSEWLVLAVVCCDRDSPRAHPSDAKRGQSSFRGNQSMKMVGLRGKLSNAAANFTDGFLTPQCIKRGTEWKDGDIPSKDNI